MGKQEIEGFGRRVKGLRREKGFTQQALADACEIDIRTIQRIEKGEFAPGLDVVYSIAKAFKLSIIDLLS